MLALLSDDATFILAGIGIMAISIGLGGCLWMLIGLDRRLKKIETVLQGSDSLPRCLPK
jgi:hypothetical protein